MSVVSKPGKKEKAPGGAVVPVAAGKARAAGPIVAAAPRANLMPPELGENQRKRSVRRGLRIIVVLVVLVGLLAVAGAWYLATATQTALAAANQETAALTKQLRSYSELQSTEDGITGTKAAVRVGGSQDVEWQSYIDRLQAALPSGVTLTKVDVKGGDPATPFAQSEVPLEQPRIAELTFTAETSTLPSIPDWIDRLSAMPGFADATPGSLDFDESKYTATVTMHIDTDAYSYRFAPKPKGASK